MSPDEPLFIMLGAGIYAPCAELVFHQMAAELDLVDLIRFGFDLCGTYIPGHGSADTAYDAAPLTSVSALALYCEAHAASPYINKAARAVKHILDSSASPLESNLAMQLSLPMSMGGYGLEQPVMNLQYKQAGKVRFPDLYWEKYKLDIEYDSDEFHADPTPDAERRNELQATLKVLTVTRPMAQSLARLDNVVKSYCAATGKRMRVRTKDYPAKQSALHAQLASPEWYRRIPPKYRLEL